MPSLPILVNVVPDSSGNVLLKKFSDAASTANWHRVGFSFADSSSKDSMDGSFAVPADYSSGAQIRVVTSADVTAGSATLAIEYRAVANGENMDQSGVQGSVSYGVLAPGTALYRRDHTFSLTDGHFSAEDDVSFRISRINNDGVDDLADEFWVLDAHFEYS
jgi:hypothetical protein